MTTKQLLASLDADQTKALNTLLLEQRDDLVAHHQESHKELAEAKTEELASLQKQVAKYETLLAKRAEEIAALNLKVEEQQDRLDLPPIEQRIAELQANAAASLKEAARLTKNAK